MYKVLSQTFDSLALAISYADYKTQVLARKIDVIDITGRVVW